MSFSIVPVVVMVIGLLLWAAPVPPFVKSVGDKMFTCGLLVSLFVFSGTTVHLGLR